MLSLYIFNGKKLLGNIFQNQKIFIKSDKKSNIVYKISCKDCNVSYIGETKRTFKVKRAVKNQDVDKNEIAKN